MTEKVRGTRIDFPVGGPHCKYAALFDERPMFDNLRKAFLLHGSSDSTPSRFLSLLESRADNHAFKDFTDALRAWATPSSMSSQPHNFGGRAWPAYLHAISRSSYFFAVDELISVCMIHRVSIAVFKERRGH